MKAVALAACALAASGETPPNVIHAEGQVYLENSVLSTTAGRAAVTLKPGITLRLGENSSVRMKGSGIEILTGSAFVIADASRNSITIDCEDVVTLSTAGVYRFDATPPWAGSNVCRLKVYEGSADVRLKTVNDPVLTGQMMNMSRACADMIPLLEFDPADADRLEENGHFRSGWIVAKRR